MAKSTKKLGDKKRVVSEPLTRTQIHLKNQPTFDYPSDLVDGSIPAEEFSDRLILLIDENGGHRHYTFASNLVVEYLHRRLQLLTGDKERAAREVGVIFGWLQHHLGALSNAADCLFNLIVGTNILAKVVNKEPVEARTEEELLAGAERNFANCLEGINAHRRRSISFDRVVDILHSQSLFNALGIRFDGDSLSVVGQELKESKRQTLLNLWGALTPAERLRAKYDFELIEIEDYHRMIFGTLDVPATVEGLQSWLNDNKNSRCMRYGIPFTAKALQHFCRELRVLLLVADPATKERIACRVEAVTRVGHGSDYFAFKPPGRKSRPVTQPASLPELALIAE